MPTGLRVSESLPKTTRDSGRKEAGCSGTHVGPCFLRHLRKSLVKMPTVIAWVWLPVLGVTLPSSCDTPKPRSREPLNDDILATRALATQAGPWQRNGKLEKWMGSRPNE